MSRGRIFLFLIAFCILLAKPIYSFEISDNYKTNHTEFEINFLESLSGLSEFDNLSKNQLDYLEKNFESYAIKTYGSMDRAYNLLAYSLNEYALKFNDLIKLIETELKKIDNNNP